MLKLDAVGFREKLAGCGQLSELKARLAEFGKAAKATRERQTKKLIPKLTSPTKNEIIDIERLGLVSFMGSDFLLCFEKDTNKTIGYLSICMQDCVTNLLVGISINNL